MANKLSKQDWENRMKQRFPEESFQLIQYVNAGKPAQIKCKSCNEIIQVSKLSNFFAANKVYGCKNCHGLWRKREVKMDEISKSYEILGYDVKDTHKYYKIRCKQCGHIRQSTLNNLYKNLECGCKTGCLRNRTGEEFIKECNKYHNNELQLVGEYTGQQNKVLLRHKPCGFIWLVRAADIIHGRSHCPKCRISQSLGEKAVRLCLQENNIIFQQQAQLIQNTRFKFDFWLPEYNTIIQYHGKQHYYFTPFFHETLQKFEEHKRWDAIKQEWCKNKGVNLLIIPYNSKNSIQAIIQDMISSTTKVEQALEKAVLP